MRLRSQEWLCIDGGYLQYWEAALHDEIPSAIIFCSSCVHIDGITLAALDTKAQSKFRLEKSLVKILFQDE